MKGAVYREGSMLQEHALALRERKGVRALEDRKVDAQEREHREPRLDIRRRVVVRAERLQDARVRPQDILVERRRVERVVLPVIPVARLRRMRRLAEADVPRLLVVVLREAVAVGIRLRQAAILHPLVVMGLRKAASISNLGRA
jgi:hypothetical protein